MKKDWTDTVLAAVMGIATIALGAALISTGGPFLALLGKSLVFQGIGDCFSAVRAVIEGEPIRMEDFLKSKAIGVGIAILTAGIAYTGVNAGWFSVESVYGSNAVNAVADASAIEVGKVTATQAAGVMRSMTGEVIKSAVTSSLIAEGVREVADIGIKEYLKKNDGDIERDIADELNALFNDYGEDLVSILASDIWGNRDILKRELLQDAGDIMRKYERGKTAMKIGKSLTNSAIGYRLPGWAAGVTNAAINVGSGAYKSLQAAEKFSQKFAGSIKEKSGKRKTTYAMFESRLQESYKHEWQDIIMKMRQYAGEFGQAEISYANCAKYSGVELGSEKKTAALVNICEEIAAVMEKASTESLAQLKAQLQDDLLGRIKGVYKNEIFHPTFDFVKFLYEGAWDKYKEKKQEEAKDTKQKKTAEEQAAESRRAVADEVAWVLGSEELNSMAETAQEEMTKAQQKKQQRDNEQEEVTSWKKVDVNNKESVNKIYGGQASQQQLEQFIEMNPYIATRGVIRDEKGNIIHLEIRVGEKILVPENIAKSHEAKKRDYYSIINDIQRNTYPTEDFFRVIDNNQKSTGEQVNVGKRGDTPADVYGPPPPPDGNNERKPTSGQGVCGLPKINFKEGVYTAEILSPKENEASGKKLLAEVYLGLQKRAVEGNEAAKYMLDKIHKGDINIAEPKNFLGLAGEVVGDAFNLVKKDNPNFAKVWDGIWDVAAVPGEVIGKGIAKCYNIEKEGILDITEHFFGEEKRTVTENNILSFENRVGKKVGEIVSEYGPTHNQDEALKILSVMPGYKALKSFTKMGIVGLKNAPKIIDASAKALVTGFEVTILKKGALKHFKDDLPISEVAKAYLYKDEGKLLKYRKVAVNEKAVYPDYEPSFTSGKKAFFTDVKERQKFVRVFAEHADPNKPPKLTGNWLALKEDVRNLSPKQLQEKFALPREPTHFVDVEITKPAAHHTMMIGEVAPNFGKKGGGTQFFLDFKIDPKNVDPIVGSWFKNKQKIPNGGIK